MKIGAVGWGGIGLLYAVALVSVAFFSHQRDWSFFIHASPYFEEGIPTSDRGYDGQFAYYIARDPINAAAHLDVPAYRYQRILYPFLACVLALGNTDWVAVSLVAVNVIALAVGTGLFATLIQQTEAPSWTPFVFFAFFGIPNSLLYDLNEIVAIAFSLSALVFYLQRRTGWAGFLFGLAALGKEMAFFFSMPALIDALRQRRWRDGACLGILAFAPYLGWMLILRFALGKWSFDADATYFQILPFGGLIGSDPSLFLVILIVLIIPGFLVCFEAARRLDLIYAWATLMSFAFLVFLPPYSYAGHAVFRVNLPLVLAGVLLLAQRHSRWLNRLAGLWSATAVLSWILALAG